MPRSERSDGEFPQCSIQCCSYAFTGFLHNFGLVSVAKIGRDGIRVALTLSPLPMMCDSFSSSARYPQHGTRFSIIAPTVDTCSWLSWVISTEKSAPGFQAPRFLVMKYISSILKIVMTRSAEPSLEGYCHCHVVHGVQSLRQDLAGMGGIGKAFPRAQELELLYIP